MKKEKANKKVDKRHRKPYRKLSDFLLSSKITDPTYGQSEAEDNYRYIKACGQAIVIDSFVTGHLLDDQIAYKNRYHSAHNTISKDFMSMISSIDTSDTQSKDHNADAE